MWTFLPYIALSRCESCEKQLCSTDCGKSCVDGWWVLDHALAGGVYWVYWPLPSGWNCLPIAWLQFLGGEGGAWLQCLQCNLTTAHTLHREAPLQVYVDETIRMTNHNNYNYRFWCSVEVQYLCAYVLQCIAMVLVWGTILYRVYSLNMMAWTIQLFPSFLPPCP